MWATLIFSGTAALFLDLDALCTRAFALGTVAVGVGDAHGGGRFRTPPTTDSLFVIIAGRNEEARIEQTIRRLLAQRGMEQQLWDAEELAV